MNGCKFTAFGLQVKTALLEMGGTQEWLEKKVTERTGLFVDSGYMYKILTGQRAAPKITKAIREILEIPDAPAEQYINSPLSGRKGGAHGPRKGRLPGQY